MSTPEPNFRLTEQQIRDKVIELLDLCNQRRMDMWIMSGVTAGVLDASLVAKVLVEEIDRREHDVKRFWKGACNCHGQLN